MHDLFKPIQRRLCLAALAILCATPAIATAPDWAAKVTDIYVGREWNAGVMACARTEFSLQGGVLIGHYWVDDPEPFEGELTGFIPAGRGGEFTWTDRYGEGVLRIRFADDLQSFTSQWGTGPDDVEHPGFGRRGADARVPGCGSATS